jgi:hypothetical protein
MLLFATTCIGCRSEKIEDERFMAVVLISQTMHVWFDGVDVVQQ